MLPRLVLLAACEKVITDTSGLISLITLLEKLEVTVPPAVGNSKHVPPHLVKGSPRHLGVRKRRSSSEVKELPPSGENDVQNNVDALWTWSVNGAKVAGSFVIITGAIKVIQTVLRYWTDEVVTWWGKMKRRWSTLGTKDISSDDEEEEKIRKRTM